MRRLLFFGAILVLLITGCDEETKQKPYLLGQETPAQQAKKTPSETVQSTRISAEASKEIARINKERDIEVQRLKTGGDITMAGINKEIIQGQESTRKAADEKAHEFNLYVLMLIGAALLLLFLFLFHYTGKNRKERLKKHEDELLYNLRMQEQELKMKVAGKMLDSIASGKLTPEQETRLIETLEHTTTRLIEQKK